MTSVGQKGPSPGSNSQGSAIEPLRAGRPVLEMRSVDKSYHETPVLRGISLAFHPGEIHALVGENGAGKSTLIRCCTGLVKPDRGELIIDGVATALSSLSHARRVGIRVVHQEAEFFPQLSLAENLAHASGSIPGRSWWIDRPGMKAAGQTALNRFGLQLDLEGLTSTLSVGQRMLAEIAVCVQQRSSLIFLDEPTASLSFEESDRLFTELLRLRTKQVSLVLVSHRLDEILRLADRITVLRDGQVAATGLRSAFNRERLVNAMVGRNVEESVARAARAPGKELLRLHRLTDPAGDFDEVDLTLRAGEITALYGLVGAGRSELAQAVVGLRPSHGQMSRGGQPYAPTNPKAAQRQQVVLVPEDRRAAGIFAGHACRENLTVPWFNRFSRLGFFFKRTESLAAGVVAKQMHARFRDLEQPISTLSGGNQQKLVLGRWLETQPEVLILDEPTRGIDVGAKKQLHLLIRALADRGNAVWVISSDLNEVLQLGDRIHVMRSGKIEAQFERSEATEVKLMHAALPEESALTRKKAGTSKLSGSAYLAHDFSACVVLVFLWIVLALSRGSDFTSLDNTLSVLTSASLVSIVAAGLSHVLIVGGIDVSIGSMLALVAALIGTAALHGLAPGFVVLLGLVLGAGLGALNAGVTRLTRAHPIVVTLAGIYIYRGLMLRFTGGNEVSDFSPSFRGLTEGVCLKVPKLVFAAAAVHVANAWFLNRTRYGRSLYAVGDSPKAARLSGLNVGRFQLQAFATCGAVVGFAAALWAAYYGKVQSNTGNGFELQVIAAAVIGGCAVTGGRGGALGVVAGSLLVSLVYNALILFRISSYWQGFFIGVMILTASGLNAWLAQTGRKASP